MPKPVIGINTDYRPAYKESAAHSYCHVGYHDRVLASGGIPLLIPTMSDKEDLSRLLERLDGIILTGGNDLDPRRMGLVPHPAVRVIPPRREDCDRLLCQLVLKRKVPVLAIALGMQTLNVVGGGTLWQHIPEDLPRSMPHYDPLGGSHRHALLVTPGTRMAEIYGDGEIRVNSSHHQAVRKVASGFRVSATAPDGVIESMESTAEDWFGVGIQWHPESESASALDLQVFEALVAACKGSKAGGKQNGQVPSHAPTLRLSEGEESHAPARAASRRAASASNGRRRLRASAAR